MFRKKVIVYENPEMRSKFTSQNGRILSLENTNKSIGKKHIQDKTYFDQLKIRSSEYRAKKQ